MNEPETVPPAPPAPGDSFAELPLSKALRAGVHEMGYHEPTEIQKKAIPHAVLGRDLVGTAQTGTGKTAAFLLPILERLLGRPRGQTYALVLTPTRELALQAEQFLHRLGRHTHIRGAAVYGGVGMGAQDRALRGGAEVIVATPGRLLDHIGRGAADFRSLEILVIDEADRMLDMGFLPQVRRILERLPRQRQTMLFSATMPPEVVRLARDFLREPRLVQVEPTIVAAVGVSHIAYRVPNHRKTDLLLELLRDESMASVLVFVRTKHRADRLARQLSQRGLPTSRIHGNRSQAQRVQALEAFRGGHHRVLVATDIAARGIDVEGISHVVNFDVPHEPEVYIHRVGRTARAQSRGDAVTLVDPAEAHDLARVERLLGFDIPTSRLPGFADDDSRPREARPGRGPHRPSAHPTVSDRPPHISRGHSGRGEEPRSGRRAYPRRY